jgi:ATP/maltotriose-dependent transcriptional regulator MalT
VWREIHERLTTREPSSLSAADLDTLAEALFWLDRPDESIAVRRDAYAAHRADADPAAAAMAAWQLYYDHALVGEMAVAGGWLARARQHAAGSEGSVAAGFVALAEADHAQHHDDLEAAIAHAERAEALGRSLDDRDLVAMALQTRGQLLVAGGRVADGMASLDEAMIAVTNGELSPLFTGWVYCSVLGVCHDVADLGRAAEWTEAALRWCDSLDDGLLYPGLCRVHRVELACLRGAWTTARSEAQRAGQQLLAHDPRYAGEAVYLSAEMDRLRGDLEAAEVGFQEAHALGREPQPGLALVWLARGRPAAAVASLRLALRPGPSAPLARAALLAALVEAEVAVGELERAEAAVTQLTAVARASTSPYLEAITAARHGLVLLARDELGDAMGRLRRASTLLEGLAMPYELASVGVSIARAARRAGDESTTLLELRRALATFQRLGATRDVARVQALLGESGSPTGLLTRREVEVLRLVAQGDTNRQIGARLVISQHTVARHLSNIFTKLGVTSRAAATAYAYEHDLAP